MWLILWIVLLFRLVVILWSIIEVCVFRLWCEICVYIYAYIDIATLWFRHWHCIIELLLIVFLLVHDIFIIRSYFWLIFLNLGLFRVRIFLFDSTWLYILILSLIAVSTWICFIRIGAELWVLLY